MMDALTPPPERDLPAWRVAELRTRVMAGTNRRARPRALRVVLAAAAMVTAIVAVTIVATATRGDDDVQVLAFGPGALSPELTAAVDWCLHANSPESLDPSSLAHDPGLVVGRDDLVVGVQHGSYRALAFVTGEGYLTCDFKDEGEGSGGLSVDRWTPQHRDWMPGPVERLSGMSTERHGGGDVTVIGRASADVRRIVLEYGNGHESLARISNGMFALLSDGTRVTDHATLVSYGADGRVMARSAPFERRDDDACFTDPAGTVVYGKAGNGCRPAYRWRLTRPAGNEPPETTPSDTTPSDTTPSDTTPPDTTPPNTTPPETTPADQPR